MTFRTSLYLIAASVLLAGPAQASCWSNKAICKAICGFECCDGWNYSAPADPAALEGISVRALNAEVKRMRKTSRNSAFLRAVNAEIKARRGGGSSTRAIGGATISN